MSMYWRTLCLFVSVLSLPVMHPAAAAGHSAAKAKQPASVKRAAAKNAATTSSAISYVSTVNGKPVVMLASGQPVLMYGVQLRIDNFLNGDFSAAHWTQADTYFQHARQAGFKSVNIPVWWSVVEPTEGNYDFTYVDHVLSAANTDNLQVQLLWYGADVCGFNQVPPYVAADHTRFPMNAQNPQFLDLSASALISKDTGALWQLMAHLSTADTQHRVYIVQVENEPDGAGPLNAQVQWNNPADLAAKMYAGGQFAAANNLVNFLGYTVHTSPYNVVARCNIGSSYRALDSYNARWTSPAGCDIYGIDTYSNVLSQTQPLLNTIPSSSPNVAHQPEGGGNYYNLVSLILSNFAQGGGFMVYELRTSDWSGGDSGIYRTVPPGSNAWVARDGTMPAAGVGPAPNVPPLETPLSMVQNLNTMIYKADKKIATTVPGQCAAFNLAAVASNVSETDSIGSYSVTFQSAGGGFGFGLLDGPSTLVLMSVTNGTVYTVGSGTLPAKASIGAYTASNTWMQQSTRPFQGRTLLLNAGEVARFTVQ